MNENALKLFNQTAKTIRLLEEEVSKSKNLREIQNGKTDEQKRKIAARYDAKKNAALAKVGEGKAKRLKVLDETIAKIDADLALNRKRLTELAKEVGTAPPKEPARTAAPSFAANITG